MPSNKLTCFVENQDVQLWLQLEKKTSFVRVDSEVRSTECTLAWKVFNIYFCWSNDPLYGNTCWNRENDSSLSLKVIASIYRALTKNKSPHDFSSSYEVSFSALKQYCGRLYWWNFVCCPHTSYFDIISFHHQLSPKWTAISTPEPLFQTRISNVSAMQIPARHHPHRA